MFSILKETLKDLDQELELLLEYLESEDPKDKAVAEEIFQQSLLPRLEKKIDGYVAVINQRKALREYRINEAKRIQALAKKDDSVISWLTEKLQQFLELRVKQLGEKGKKLEGKLCRISLANNGGQLPVWINQQLAVGKFPVEFVISKPILDTEKLKEAAMNSETGEVMDAQGKLLAKVMPRGKHVRIR